MLCGITTRHPASTTRSTLYDCSFASSASLNASLDAKVFGERHTASISFFFARSSAYAPALLLMTTETSAFVMVPSSIASRIACRFVPPPETRTANLSITVLLFLRFQCGRSHMAYLLWNGWLSSLRLHLPDQQPVPYRYPC